LSYSLEDRLFKPLRRCFPGWPEAPFRAHERLSHGGRRRRRRRRPPAKPG
jgi:hypothetical protein